MDTDDIESFKPIIDTNEEDSTRCVFELSSGNSEQLNIHLPELGGPEPGSSNEMAEPKKKVSVKSPRKAGPFVYVTAEAIAKKKKLPPHGKSTTGSASKPAKSGSFMNSSSSNKSRIASKIMEIANNVTNNNPDVLFDYILKNRKIDLSKLTVFKDEHNEKEAILNNIKKVYKNSHHLYKSKILSLVSRELSYSDIKARGFGVSKNQFSYSQKFAADDLKMEPNVKKDAEKPNPTAIANITDVVNFMVKNSRKLSRPRSTPVKAPTFDIPGYCKLSTYTHKLPLNILFAKFCETHPDRIAISTFYRLIPPNFKSTFKKPPQDNVIRNPQDKSLE